MLLRSQAAHSQPGRPQVIVNVRNSKDRLHNAIIKFFEEKELDWPCGEIETQGKTCVQKLTDVLWTLDGHYDVLAKQSCQVLDVFKSFEGFNLPERHKHKK